jgi:hypothetical protein
METQKGQGALSFKAAYIPKFAPSLKLTGQWVKSLWGEWTERYSGPSTPILIPGLAGGCKLDLNLVSLKADYGVDPMAGVSMGPRVEWTLYSDTFTVYGPDTATFNAQNDVKSHSHSMIGFGLAGVINPEKLAGGGYGTDLFSPGLNFALTVGGGKSMEYVAWDVFLILFKHQNEGRSRWWPFSKSVWEIGYSEYNFRWKGGDDTSTWWTPYPGIGPLLTRGEDLRYRLGIPGGRVTFAF